MNHGGHTGCQWFSWQETALPERSCDGMTFKKFHRHLEIDCDEEDVIERRRRINCTMYTLGYDAQLRAELLQMMGLVHKTEVKEEYSV